MRILGVGWTPVHAEAIETAGADVFVRKTFRPHELADAVARCAMKGRSGAAELADG